jgi:exonuclease VII small subunit
MDSRLSKIIAMVLIQCQFSMMLPAEELRTDLRRGMARLEHYLDRAAAERRAQDWEQLARTGLETAMYEWESGALWLLEQDREIWQEERQRAEMSYRKETESAYVRWASGRVYAERAGFEASELGALLREAAVKWNYGDSGRIVNLSGAEGARIAWERTAGEIVDRHIEAWEERQGLAYVELEGRFQDLGLSDEERQGLIRGVAEERRAMANREYGRIALAEGNRLMAELLYDQGSLKKLAAGEAASAVARELAREAEAAAEKRTRDLFTELDTLFSAEEEAGIEFNAGDWLNQFHSAFEEGLARWEEAELGFLAARTEWEHDAEDAYLAGEETWNKAYLELTSRQKAWETALLSKLDEGFVKWQESQSRLSTEIENARNEFLAASEESRRVKEKMMDSQAEIYIRSRQMMDIVRQGIESWYSIWNEKYLMVYTLIKQASILEDLLWRTGFGPENPPEGQALADLFKDLDENTYKSLLNDNFDIDELTDPGKNNIDTLRNQLELLKEAGRVMKERNWSLPLSIDELMSSTGDLLDEERGWLSLAVRYREYTNTAVERLYQMTGNTGERIEGYSGELQIELIKAEALLGYWDDELAVADAVNRYAQETSSIIEDAARTQAELENARLAYEKAVKNYERIVELTREKGLILDEAQVRFDEAQAALVSLRGAVEEAQQDYANVLTAMQKMNPAPVYDELANLALAILDSWEGKTKSGAEAAGSKTIEESILNYYRLSLEYTNILRSLEINALLESLESGSGLGQPGIDSLKASAEDARILSQTSREGDLRAAAGLYPAEVPISILWGTGPGEVSLFQSGRELIIALDQAYRDSTVPEEQDILLTLMQQVWKEASLWYEEEILLREQSIEYLKTGLLPKINEEAEAELRVHLAGLLAALRTAKILEDQDLGFTADELADLEILVEGILSLGSEEMAEALEEAAGENPLFAEAVGGLLVLPGESYAAAWIAQRQAKRDLGLAGAERIQLIIDRYGGYDAVNINRQNQKAREAVEALITGFRDETLNTAGKERALEYTAELRDLGRGLNQPGQEALNSYIAAFLEFTAVRDYQDNPANEFDLPSLVNDFMTAKTVYEIYSSWQYKIYDEAGWAEIAGSDGFSLINEDERNEFILYISSAAYTDLVVWVGKIITAASREFQEKSDALTYAQYYQREKDGSRFSWVAGLAACEEKMSESGVGNETLEKIGLFFTADAPNKALESLKDKALWMGIWFTGESEWNYIQYQEDAGEISAELVRAALENGWIEYQGEISLDSSLYTMVNAGLDRLQYLNKGTEELNKLKDEKKAALDEALDAYNTYIDEDYDLAVTALDQSCGDYNAAVDESDRYYREMAAARLYLRKRQEIHDWASSVYLKSFGTNYEENYRSPLEKLSQVQYARERALIAVEVLGEILGNEVPRADAQYDEAMESYKESRRDYYLAQVTAYEGERALARQQTIVREAELAEEAARRKLITKVDAVVPADYELVNLIRDEDGAYRLELAYTLQDRYISDIIGSHDPDKPENYGTVIGSRAVRKAGAQSNPEVFAEYFGNDKAVPVERVDAKEYISMAEYEAGEWLKRIGTLGVDYYDDVMLASLHIRYCAGEGSAEGNAWFNGIGDPRSSGNYTLGDIPLDFSIRGLNLRVEYNSARRRVLQDAYDRVMAREGGEEDIARYLLYRGRNIIGNAGAYEENLLKSRSMEIVSRALGETSRNYAIAFKAAMGLGASLTATGAGLMAASFFNPGFVALAGVAFAGAAAAFITAGVLDRARDQINGIWNGVKDLLAGVDRNLNGDSGYNRQFNDSYSQWEDSLACLSRERKALNLMMYGIEDKPPGEEENPELSYENFISGLSALLNTGHARTTISYDESIGLYTRELFDKSEAKTGSTVGGAVILLNLSLGKEASRQKETLDAESEKLKTDQKQNLELYYGALASTLAIPEDRQAELRAMALRAGDPSLDIAERRNAGFEYERLFTELCGETENTRKEIQTLLGNAFSDGSWDSEWYASSIIGLEGELFDSRTLHARTAEIYTEQEIVLLKDSVLAVFNQNSALALSAKEWGWALRMEDFLHQYDSWQEQVEQIKQTGLSEWQKARSKMNESYYSWQKKFSDEYHAKTDAWDINYLEFTGKKQQWVDEQYLYAVNVRSAGLFDYAEIDPARIIGQTMTQFSSERLNRESFDPSAYTDMLLEDSILGELLSRLDSLEGRVELGSPRVQIAAKRTSAAGDLAQAAKVLDEMSDDMRKAAAKLAVLDAREIIDEAIQLILDRLAAENKAMWEWEEHLVQANGYRIDGEISRQAIVDSTVFETVTKIQTVHRYQDYIPDSPPAADVDLNAAAMQDLDADTILRFVQTAHWNLDRWGETIFGRLDDSGNIIKHRIPRGVGELTAGGYTETASAEKDRVNDLTERIDKFEARGFDALTNEEKKEYERLANQLVTVRDGELGAHIGYGPLLKDEVNYRHSPLDDALDRGAGEMGRIMLDFLWNSRVSTSGYSELFKAWYDQKFWTGDYSDAFTIRDIVGMAASIGGMINPLIGLADDLLFAGLDLGIGYQNPEDVLKSLAINAATTALSYGSAAVGSSGIFGDMNTGVLKALTDSFGEKTGAVLYNALGAAAKSYTTSAAVNMMGAFNDGSFDFESFARSLYSVETLSGTLGAFTGSGLGAFTSGAMSFGDQKLYGGLVNLAVAGAGETARYSVYALDSIVNGSGDFMNRLGQAYDNMGGITVNVANLGSLLDFMGTMSYRLNENYDTKLGALGRQLAGAGLLELALGRGDVSLSLGMGGLDVVGNLYDSVKHNLDYAILKYGDYEDSQNRGLLLNNYLYGGWEAENTSMRIEAGRDLLVVDSDGTVLGNGTPGYTMRRISDDGRIIGIADRGDANTNTILLQHESYRDGYVTSGNDAETVAAVLAHTAMAAKMMNDGMDFKLDGTLLNDLLAYYGAGGDMTALARYALENYDSSRDYWKLMNDGTLVNDKRGWLVDEEGRPILNSEGKQIGADGIETGLLNILYGGTSRREYGEFTINQIAVIQYIMMSSGMEYNGEGYIPPSDRKWTDVPEGKALNTGVVMSLVKDTVAETIFSKIFPEVDRYAVDNSIRAGIENYIPNSSMYTEIIKKLNNSYISTSERMDLISQLQLVNTEAVISYIYDQLPPAEQASRKIYEKDFVNARERLLQLQESQSSSSFGSTLALASLMLAGGRYVYGSENPLYASEAGVDCSGAILFSLQLMGYNIPRSTANTIITSYTNKVTTVGILPGDINALPDSRGIITHVQTLTGGTGLVDPYGGGSNIISNPGKVKYRTTLPSGFDVYRLDLSKIGRYYNPSLDIMSGRLTISQFNTAWERLAKYHQ